MTSLFKVIAEQCLEDDAVTFDLFLKENDKSSVEAIRQAEVEMRRKLEKGILIIYVIFMTHNMTHLVAEVKRLSNIIRGIQTEISKQEEKLSELKRYRMFTDQLTPGQYRKKTKKTEVVTGSDTHSVGSNETSKLKKINSATRVSQKSSGHRRGSNAPTPHRRDSRTSAHSSSIATNTTAKIDEVEEEDSDDEEPQLFFKDPADLLKMFHELEDQNLSLIQNGQDMEETIEELKHQSKVSLLPLYDHYNL